MGRNTENNPGDFNGSYGGSIHVFPVEVFKLFCIYIFLS